jgi:hypothetical protein
MMFCVIVAFVMVLYLVEEPWALKNIVRVVCSITTTTLLTKSRTRCVITAGLQPYTYSVII